ncbi:MAG: Na+/alanine symporter [Chlamydiota bacterium]|jgi:AGCS family alanine or glycine:cation symporter
MFETAIQFICDWALYISCLFLLTGHIFISFKTRFIQLRLLPRLFKLAGSLFSAKTEGQYTIKPYKALFTAMSTTLGIGTIVAPVIAICLGGPGALVGFLLTSFFGSAATYLEVELSVKYRQKLDSGKIMGGPMQYLSHLVSKKAAVWYGVCCFILMPAWSGAQANQLAAMLSSPLLGAWRISTFVTGSVIALIVVSFLMGGIKKIGKVESKLVPVKFILYVTACFFILFSDFPRFIDVLSTIISSALSPYTMASGAAVGGLMSSLRWGVFKGLQCCEAGLGTQTIPHSMAETKDPEAQATLAMLSTYAAGFIAFLSGCVALMTGTWQDPSLPLGMSMVAASFQLYFSSFGVGAIAACALVFAFGTILGNGYNGSQAYGFLTQNKRNGYYYALTALFIFLGSVCDAKMVWALTDVILAAMALPHITALMLYTIKKPALQST